MTLFFGQEEGTMLRYHNVDYIGSFHQTPTQCTWRAILEGNI